MSSSASNYIGYESIVYPVYPAGSNSNTELDIVLAEGARIVEIRRAFANKQPAHLVFAPSDVFKLVDGTSNLKTQINAFLSFATSLLKSRGRLSSIDQAFDELYAALQAAVDVAQEEMGNFQKAYPDDWEAQVGLAEFARAAEEVDTSKAVPKNLFKDEQLEIMNIKYQMDSIKAAIKDLQAKRARRERIVLACIYLFCMHARDSVINSMSSLMV